jgi:hypothetical protein
MSKRKPRYEMSPEMVEAQVKGFWEAQRNMDRERRKLELFDELVELLGESLTWVERADNSEAYKLGRRIDHLLNEVSALT